MRNDDTIAAVATPPGEGGVAIIRVSGTRAIPIAASVFAPSRGDAAVRPRTARYGRFKDPRTGDVLDDGLLLAFRAPRSYTGEDVVELSCHGGSAATAALLRLVIDAGARLAEPGEFTLRAFYNGRLDLAQAEAVADVVRAQTETSLRQAHYQLEGRLSRAVNELKDELIGILASIEVTIDFSDEVGELDYDALSARISAVQSSVSHLLATAQKGRIVRDGLRVALIGRPNVGKSSLFNALLRADRAIVTPIAGTTRDRLEESASIRGIPLVLVDLAGLRETQDIVERQGVALAENAAASADVVLFVVDLSEGLTPDDLRIADRLDLTAAARMVVALNKCDLASRDRARDARLAVQDVLNADAVVEVSAITGSGLEDLEAALVDLPDQTSSGGAVVAAARHRDALQAAAASLTEALSTTENRLPGDFVAIDVRGALDALGQITGETVTEEVIHRIFHDFCVGK